MSDDDHLAMLSDAREETHAARSAMESERYEEAIDHWQRALDLYQEAQSVAQQQGNTSITPDISESIENVNAKLDAAKREQELTEIRTALESIRESSPGESVESRIDHYESALEQLSELSSRARDVDEPEVIDAIERQRSEFEERLGEAKRERARERLRDETARGRESIRNADQLLPAVARDWSTFDREDFLADTYEQRDQEVDRRVQRAGSRYERAREEYSSALREHSEAFANLGSEGVEKRCRRLITHLENAQDECVCLEIAATVAFGVYLFGQGSYNRAIGQFERANKNVQQAEVAEVYRDRTSELSTLASSGQVQSHVVLAYECVSEGKSLAAEAEYRDAAEQFRRAKEEVAYAEEITETAGVLEFEPVLSQLRTLSETYLNDIEQALASLDETPSLAPLEADRPTPQVTMSDLPPMDELADVVPVLETVWREIDPERFDERESLLKILESDEWEEAKPYLDEQLVTELDGKESRLRNLDPLTDPPNIEQLCTRTHSLLTDVADELLATVHKHVETLEDEELPADFYDGVSLVDPELFESIHETDELSDYVDAWIHFVSGSLETLDMTKEKVAIIHNSNEVFEHIDESLHDTGEVDADELPVENGSTFLKIYNYRNDSVSLADGKLSRDD